MSRVLFKPCFCLLIASSFFGCTVDDIIVPDSERVVPEDYHCFAEEGKVWVYAAAENADDLHESYRYQIVGDTLLNGKNYKKMYLREAATYGDSEWHYIGAVRDTLMKVRFVDKGKRDERLLYDFGLVSGNILRWYGYILLPTNPPRKYIEGIMRNVVDVYTSDNKFKDSWVEGIGAAMGVCVSFDPIRKERSILVKCLDPKGLCYDCKTNYPEEY